MSLLGRGFLEEVAFVQAGEVGSISASRGERG